MRIVVEELLAAGRRLAGQAHIDLPGDQDADELAVREPVRYDFAVSRLGSTVSIQGHLEARVEVACSRCAHRFELAVDRDFQAVFVPSDAGETDRAMQLDAGEPDLAFYQYGVLCGRGGLAAQLAEALGGGADCAGDCKGLCTRCGANLNHTDCDCEAEVDPRWALLKSLRDQL